MNDLTLYDMASELQDLHDEIEAEDGEISPDLEETLDRLNMQLTDKAGNIGRWMLSLDRTTDALNTEIARLERRRDARLHLQDRLKSYLKLCMEKADTVKVELPALTIRIQKNPPSVEVTDETKIPARFVRIKQITELDKTNILSALRTGEDVPGARLVTDKTHLRIR